MGDCVIKGRGMAPGFTTGNAIVCNQTISPLGEMSRSGLIVSGPCSGKSFSNKILIFKGGRGSTVGSYVLLELKNNNIAPSGIINEEAEQVILTGAIISEIPLIDRIPLDIFRDNDRITMNGRDGTVVIENVIEKDVATVYLLRGSKILLLKRSDKVSTYAGEYTGISGYVKDGENPLSTAKRELEEEYGISDSTLLKEGGPVYVRRDNILIKIIPYIMTTKTENIILNWEYSEYHWIDIEDLKLIKTEPKFKETFYRIYSGP